MHVPKRDSLGLQPDCKPLWGRMLNRALGGPRMGSPRPQAPLLLLLQHLVAGYSCRIPCPELLQVPAGLSSAQSTERGEKIPESFVPHNSGGGEKAQNQHLGCPSSSGERGCVKEAVTLVIGAHGDVSGGRNAPGTNQPSFVGLNKAPGHCSYPETPNSLESK